MALQEITTALTAMTSMRLGNLSVCILDVDIPHAQMTRQILSTIGVTKTFLTRNAEEVFALLETRPVDALIIEWDAKPMDGLELTKMIRESQSLYRMVPIMLTTTRDFHLEKQISRNTGANDLLIKPINPRTMADRLITLIDRPRAFVLSSFYTGPCRRLDPPTPEMAERRRQVPLVIAKDAAAGIFHDGMPRIIRPDFSLKIKLEAQTARMGGLENLLPKSEAVKHTDDFIQWILTDISAMEQANANLIARPGMPRSPLERLARASRDVKMRAQTFDYMLGARVADSLINFCERQFVTGDSHHVTIIQKHIESLRAIFLHRLTGNGGPIGNELFEELQQLIRKYT